MSKRKGRYARYLASVLAASMAVPQSMPIVNAYAQTSADDIGQDRATPSVPIPVSDLLLDTGDATVQAQYQLGLSITNIKSKEWDGTDSVGSYSRQLTGAISGHENITIQSMDIRFEDSELGTGKTVIVDNIQLSGSDAALYEMSKERFEYATDAAITKRKLSVSGSAVDRYFKEGDTSTPFNLKLANVAPCDVSDSKPIVEHLSVSVTGHYQDADAGTGKAVIVDDIVLSGNHSGYYTIDSKLDGLTGTILKAKRNAPDLSYTNDAIIGTNDTMEYRISGSAWTTCAGSIPLSESGTYEVRYKETSNYEASGIFKLTYGSDVTDPSGFYFDFQDGFVPTKEYDGTTKAAAKLKVGGIVDGDDVKIESYSIVYESPGVNNSVNVTLSNIKLGGKDAAKYQPYADQISHTVKGVIKPRTIDIHIAANDKDYDGTTAANLYVCGHTSYVNDENVDIAANGTFSNAAAGEEKEVSISEVTLTGTDRGNYVIGSVKPAKIQDGSLVELPKLIATIRKAPQDAPDRNLFSVVDEKIIGYTSEMEVLLPNETVYKDCASISKIAITEGSSYVFRYKEKENYKAGATTTINIGVVKTVTITFDLNGERVTGSYPTSAKKTTGQKYGDILLDVTPEDPDREFLGWFTQASGGDQVNPDDICDRTTDFTLYAHFTDKKNDRKDGQIKVHMDSFTYGDTQKPPSVENITGDYTDYVYYYKKTADPDNTYSVENPKLPGDYTVKAVAQKTGQYNGTEATAQYTINKRLLTASFTATDRVYNGTVECGGTLSVTGSKITGDDMEVDSSNLKAAFENKNVGTDKKVTVTGITLAGSHADRYELEIKGATADITPYPLNYKETSVQAGDTNAFSVSADEKVYDASNAATLHVQFTKIAGDDIEAKANGVFKDPNAGTGKDITVTSVSLTGTDAGNYKLSAQSGMMIKGTIKKAANDRYPNISGTNPTLGKNNGSITGLTTDMEYSNDGGATWISCPGAQLENLAPREYKVRYKETENYRASGISSITLKDSSSQTISVTFDLNGETVSGEYPSTATVVKGSAFGNVIRTITPADSAREFMGWFTDPAGGTQVTAETICDSDGPITLYAHFKNKEEKQEGKITVSMAGFVYGDAAAPVASNVQGNYTQYNFFYKKAESPEGDYTQEVPSVPGNYTVKAVAAATDSYHQATAEAAFTIQPRKLNLSFLADEKVYDSVTSVNGYKYKYDNILEEDKGKISFDLSNLNIHYQDKFAGDEKELVVSGVELTGEKATCYSLPDFISGKGTIRKKNISVEITGISKAYDGTDKAEVNIKPNGLIGNDAVTFQYEARFEDAKEGKGKTVYVTGIVLTGKDAVNYELNTTKVETTADIAANLNTVYLDASDVGPDIKIEPLKLKIGDPYPALPELTPSDIQKRFIGWFKEDGTQVKEGTIYQGEQKLYARVEIKEAETYTVRFDLNGGSSLTDIVDSIQIKTGDRYPALPNVVSTDSSKPFIGWFTAEGKQVREGDAYQGDLVLYAHYGVRSEGRIEVSAKAYAYGETPTISVRVMSGDYEQSAFTYHYRSKSEDTWYNGTPVKPGEYVVRVTVQATEHTLGTSAECNVNVTKRYVTIAASDTGKIYDGSAQAKAVLSLTGLINNDDVKVQANIVYDSAMPGPRKLFVTSSVLSGADAGNYKLSNADCVFDAVIDKMPGIEVSVAAQAETIYGICDGKIVGTTKNMEWRESGAQDWTICPDGALTGLANGDYEIRMRETDVSYSGPVAVIKIVSERTLGLTIMDESGHTETIGIPYGQTIDQPATPVKSGYTFGGWYQDPELTKEWDFKHDTVTDDVTLYPRWVKNSSGGSGGSSGGHSSGNPSNNDPGTYGPGTAAENGEWTRDTAGCWRFSSGRRYENEWAYVVNPYADTKNGQNHADWFHFGADGVMDVGWITDADGYMYYLNAVSDNTMGRMLTGWNWLRGADDLLRCYYFEPVSNGHRGSLYRNTTTPDGYEVGSDGAWIVNGSAVTRE